MRRVVRGLLALALGGAGLSACTHPAPPEAPPVVRPAPAPAPPVPRSARSLAESDRLARREAHLLDQGLLRKDGGGPDSPFTDRHLAENFARIAFFDEITAQGGALVATASESPLKRWEAPIRLRLVFGDSVPLAQRQKDRAAITAYAARLSSLTGHPIRVGARGNFTVMILNVDEREAAGPLLRAAVPGIAPAAVGQVTMMPQATDCQMFAFTAPGGFVYTDAIAVIRGEQPDLSRLACLHEEIAQGLGLPNDSPSARPSIFNDNDEFALLTRQDELMLRMLYDPRLRPGMSLSDARPIIAAMAAELAGAGTS